MILGLLFAVQSASAWGWVDIRFGDGEGCSGLNRDTSAITWKWGDMTLFNGWEQAAVVAGLDAWDAGSSEFNRGAVLDLEVAGTTTSPDPTDFVDEIWHTTPAEAAANWALDDSWIGIAPNVADASCTAVDAGDIIFNEDKTWHIGLPSGGASNAQSIMAVTVHEAGHSLGLAHEPDYTGVMYGAAFSEHGSVIRIGEDDFDAIRTLFPGSSTGKNFLLSKWTTYTNNPDEVRPAAEGWTNIEKNGKPWAGNFFVGVCGFIAVSEGPSRVLASVNGTSSSAYTNVPMEWTLSSNTTCFDADDITIGTRSANMSSDGSPNRWGPSGGGYTIPTSTPNGDYYVCAGINPDETLSEAMNSYDDNVVISEATWYVNCP